MKIGLLQKKDIAEVLKFEMEYTDSKENIEQITERFNKFPKLFAVCYENDGIVGEASGYVKLDKIILHSISVKDGYRNKGIGKKVLKFFEKNAKEYGDIISVTSEESVAIEDFYKTNYYTPKSILIQIKLKNVPEDYKEKSYSLINEREEGDTKFLYIKSDEYHPEIKKELKEEYNAFSVNIVFEKEI